MITNNIMDFFKDKQQPYGQHSFVTGATGRQTPWTFTKEPTGGIRQQYPNYRFSLTHPESWNPFEEAFPWQGQAQHIQSDAERQMGYLGGIMPLGKTRMRYAGPKGFNPWGFLFPRPNIYM